MYILGQAGDLGILRSDDDGRTWSSVSHLTRNETWHQSACNVWYKDDFLYLVMERTDGDGTVYDWPVCCLAPVPMKGRVDADLTKRENWTFASSKRFRDWVDEDAPEYHGIPFYPTRKHFRKGERPVVTPPVGWLETNVVQILDPDHCWYDGSGRTFHLFLRAHTAGTGYCALAKVVEKDDGTQETLLEQVPSGRTVAFLPMPGGQMRFHVLYDPATRLYWLLSAQATDGMTRKERLGPERYDIPCDERQRLQLSFSKNCVDRCFAGLVAAGPSEKQARHYACMAFDGDDLVLASRSGDHRARSAHNGNFISFHRVRDFRSLAY